MRDRQALRARAVQAFEVSRAVSRRLCAPGPRLIQSEPHVGGGTWLVVRLVRDAGAVVGADPAWIGPAEHYGQERPHGGVTVLVERLGRRRPVAMPETVVGDAYAEAAVCRGQIAPTAPSSNGETGAGPSSGFRR